MPTQRSRQDLEARACKHDPPPPERGVPVAGVFIVVFVVISAIVGRLTGSISPGGR